MMQVRGDAWITKATKATKTTKKTVTLRGPALRNAFVSLFYVVIVAFVGLV